jgi:NAD(P)-dependent dehydrogenase (short-subunit alcohol dehydrogenase family)
VREGNRCRRTRQQTTLRSSDSRIAGLCDPHPGAYAASRHALCALTDSLVAECAGFGIKAYCIEPGFFATSITDKDTVTRLDADDPYKAVADGVEQVFRASVAAAPPPTAVTDLLLAAADGALPEGIHHRVGVPGLLPTASSLRG